MSAQIQKALKSGGHMFQGRYVIYLNEAGRLILVHGSEEIDISSVAKMSQQIKPIQIHNTGCNIQDNS